MLILSCPHSFTTASEKLLFIQKNILAEDIFWDWESIHKKADFKQFFGRQLSSLLSLYGIFFGQQRNQLRSKKEMSFFRQNRETARKVCFLLFSFGLQEMYALKLGLLPVLLKHDTKTCRYIQRKRKHHRITSKIVTMKYSFSVGRSEKRWFSIFRCSENPARLKCVLNQAQLDSENVFNRIMCAFPGKIFLNSVFSIVQRARSYKSVLFSHALIWINFLLLLLL